MQSIQLLPRFAFVALLLISAIQPALAQTQEPGINTRIVSDTMRNGRVKYYLSCETTESFTNGGYTIDFKNVVEGNTYRISFTDVKAPKKGTRHADVARLSIPLGKLEHGIYSFEFTDVRGGKEITWTKTLVVSLDGVSWFTPIENPQK